jgi:hypothetical protein
MTARHIVAIGGSDAGISAALRARELDPTTDVTGAGDVYIADSGNSRVLKLAAGATAQNVLPFTELNDPASLPCGMSMGRVQLQPSAPNELGSALTGVANARAAPSVIAAVNTTFVINNGSFLRVNTRR